MTLSDERDLIQRVAHGDRQAFEQIYDRYQPRLARFVSRLTRRSDLVEEVVNDSMVVVWRTADRFRGASQLSTWVMGIAYRVALKRLRRRPQWAEEALSEDYPATDRESAERRVARRQSRERIQAALEKLSAEQRAVVELTFFDGCSYQEIARILDCPENTVKTRMFHARRRLKRLLRSMEV